MSVRYQKQYKDWLESLLSFAKKNRTSLSFILLILQFLSYKNVNFSKLALLFSHTVKKIKISSYFSVIVKGDQNILTGLSSDGYWLDFEEIWSNLNNNKNTPLKNLKSFYSNSFVLIHSEIETKKVEFHL
jgi:hypothetical protein